MIMDAGLYVHIKYALVLDGWSLSCMRGNQHGILLRQYFIEHALGYGSLMRTAISASLWNSFRASGLLVLQTLADIFWTLRSGYDSE